MIRRAISSDLPIIEEIYEAARAFMRQTGNPNQWGTKNPPVSFLVEDIEIGRLYVVEREGKICGCFMFEIAEDPTYRVIEGEWLDDSPYGVIHRVASLPEEHGIFKEVFSFAYGRITHLRIDTHHDNKIMQRVLGKYGFSPCGIIHLANGSPRIAYEYIAKNPSRP